MSSTLGASLLRTVLSDGTLKILGSGLDKGPIIGSGKLRDDDDELRKLRQQVKDLQQENDFLKKASAFFAKNLK